MMYAVPRYLFSNNSMDAVEEATARDLMPIFGMRGQDEDHYERLFRGLEKRGIDTEKGLADALDENPQIDDYEFEYVESDEAKNIALASGAHVIKLTAKTESGNTFSMTFFSLEKTFRTMARVIMVSDIHFSKGDRRYAIHEENYAPFIASLFADDEDNAGKVIAEAEAKLGHL